LGNHRKPSRIATAATVPALAGAVAAVCLTHPATPPHTTVVPRAEPVVLDAAVAPGFTQPAARPGTTSLSSDYTVEPGDTLSGIAYRFYRNPGDWPVIYWANHRRIRWADIIYTGQVLHIPAALATVPAEPVNLSPPAPSAAAADDYAPRHAVARPSSPVASSPGQEAPAASAAPAAPDSPVSPLPPSPAATVPPSPESPAAAAVAYAGGTPGGAFGECVVARESGGDPQVMNASGHYGLYQFSESTWIAAGGSAATFGDATVAEQESVFESAYSRWGASPWAPYDGC